MPSNSHLNLLSSWARWLLAISAVLALLTRHGGGMVHYAFGSGALVLAGWCSVLLANRQRASLSGLAKRLAARDHSAFGVLLTALQLGTMLLIGLTGLAHATTFSGSISQGLHIALVYCLWLLLAAYFVWRSWPALRKRLARAGN